MTKEQDDDNNDVFPPSIRDALRGLEKKRDNDPLRALIERIIGKCSRKFQSPLEKRILSLMSPALSPTTPQEIKNKIMTLGEEALNALRKGDEKNLKEKLNLLNNLYQEFSEPDIDT